MKSIVVLGWLVVFGGWLVGVWRDRLPAKEAVRNRWHCRIYGITAAGALLATALDIGKPRKPPPRRVSLPLLLPFLGGVALYYWARLSIGRNWSSEARITPSHCLVVDGAYGIVRHPIYASKVLMALSSGAMLGNRVVVALGLLLASAALYQARIEEGLLARHFPVQHEAYRRRTGMLVPKLGRRDD